MHAIESPSDWQLIHMTRNLDENLKLFLASLRYFEKNHMKYDFNSIDRIKVHNDIDQLYQELVEVFKKKILNAKIGVYISLDLKNVLDLFIP